MPAKRCVIYFAVSETSVAWWRCMGSCANRSCSGLHLARDTALQSACIASAMSLLFQQNKQVMACNGLLLAVMAHVRAGASGPLAGRVGRLTNAHHVMPRRMYIPVTGVNATSSQVLDACNVCQGCAWLYRGLTLSIAQARSPANRLPKDPQHAPPPANLTSRSLVAS